MLLQLKEEPPDIHTLKTPFLPRTNRLLTKKTDAQSCTDIFFNQYYWNCSDKYQCFFYRTEGKYGWLSTNPAYVSWKHEEDKVVCFERAGCLFVFNFHVNKSFADYRVGIDQPGYYQLVLDTDAEAFGGHNRVDAR